jgi:hypothetical protein
MKRFVPLLLLLGGAWSHAQEANSGFELRTTITGQGTYSHQSDDSATGAVRVLFYPTIKFDEHWSIDGVVQVHSQPFFFEELSTGYYGVRTDLLQAHLTYSRFWGKKSLTVKAGQLSTAFGSFLLRYDDTQNPLVGIPPTYGYYYDGTTTKGLTGAEVDSTLGKLDLRGQFTNSSPANPRSIFDSDQYGAWTGGAGYTIQQGFRVGVSGYRGPYLDRQDPFFRPGEIDPRDLPGSGVGVDVEWGSGPWNVNGEWRRYVMQYTKVPNFLQQSGYGEIKRTLHPRWYVAARLGYLRTSAYPAPNTYEMAVGYRPNSHQLVKLEYEIQQSPLIRGTLQNVLAVQVVTTLKPLTIAGR